MKKNKLIIKKSCHAWESAPPLTMVTNSDTKNNKQQGSKKNLLLTIFNILSFN